MKNLRQNKLKLNKVYQNSHYVKKSKIYRNGKIDYCNFKKWFIWYLTIKKIKIEIYGFVSVSANKY